MQGLCANVGTAVSAAEKGNSHKALVTHDLLSALMSDPLSFLGLPPTHNHRGLQEPDGTSAGPATVTTHDGNHTTVTIATIPNIPGITPDNPPPAQVDPDVPPQQVTPTKPTPPKPDAPKPDQQPQPQPPKPANVTPPPQQQTTVGVNDPLLNVRAGASLGCLVNEKQQRCASLKGCAFWQSCCAASLIAARRAAHAEAISDEMLSSLEKLCPGVTGYVYGDHGICY